MQLLKIEFFNNNVSFFNFKKFEFDQNSFLAKIRFFGQNLFFFNFGPKFLVQSKIFLQPLFYKYFLDFGHHGIGHEGIHLDTLKTEPQLEHDGSSYSAALAKYVLK